MRRTSRGRGCRSPPTCGRRTAVVEGRVERVEARTPPSVLPVEVSSPASKTASAPAASATARATAVHADVVVPVGRRGATTVSPSSRLAQVEVGGRLGGVAVEDLALVVGADGALDQPPGLAGGDVAADLDVRRAPSGSGTSGPRNVAQRLPLARSPSTGSARRRSRAATTATPSTTSAAPSADEPCGSRDRARRARGAAARPTSSQTTIGTSAERRAPRSAASTTHVGERPRGPWRSGPPAGRRCSA